MPIAWYATNTNQWWVRYPNPVANYLLTLPYPEVTIDPTDNEMDKVKGQTSQSTSQRFMKTNLESSKHKQFVKAPSKDDSKHQKQADVLNNIGYAPMYNEFSPRLNVFVRPAEEKVSKHTNALCSRTRTLGVHDGNRDADARRPGHPRD